jgi:hypothetical protein
MLIENIDFYIKSKKVDENKRFNELLNDDKLVLIEA